MEEVTCRLSLKDEEKSARRSTGKCVPIRRNRMCKVLDSRRSGALWLEGRRGAWGGGQGLDHTRLHGV